MIKYVIVLIALVGRTISPGLLEFVPKGFHCMYSLWKIL